jgi:hypothetical protein
MLLNCKKVRIGQKSDLREGGLKLDSWNDKSSLENNNDNDNDNDDDYYNNNDNVHNDNSDTNAQSKCKDDLGC